MLEIYDPPGKGWELKTVKLLTVMGLCTAMYRMPVSDLNAHVG